MITTAEVRSALREIRKHRNTDPERAHSLRDQLYRDVLKAIAEVPDGGVWKSVMAEEALKAEKIKLGFDACA